MIEEKLEEELHEHYRIVIDPKQSAIRIDKFLMDRIERTTRNKIQNACRSGGVRVNDKPVKANYKIKPGQTITMVLPKPVKDGRIEAEKMDLDIRYEDDDLIVLHKPAGLVVHPGIGNKNGTLVNGLAYHISNLPILPGNLADRPGLVHRIDKNTSGLMVIAKSEYAMTHLAKQFFDHSIERKYVAIVWGQPNEDAGTITGHIGRHPNNRLQMTVHEDESLGKHATTHYKVLEGLYYVSLVECQLETGRTHQIRVHMKHMGHPLFSDERYGGTSIVKGTVYTKYKQFVQNCFKLLPRQALHAKSLGFEHPTTGERMYFECEPPEDFTSALTKWRKYLNSVKK